MLYASVLDPLVVTQSGRNAHRYLHSLHGMERRSVRLTSHKGPPYDMTVHCQAAETDAALFLLCRHRKFLFQEPPSHLLDGPSERPGAVKGAPVLRGEGNP